MTNLPPNVYTLAQHRFDAIPGNPWVYWTPEAIRRMFEILSKLGDVAEPKHGLSTCNNSRYLRYWWEIGPTFIAFDCSDHHKAYESHKKWFPYMKGGTYRKWFGNQEWIVNWFNDGEEIKADVTQKFPYLKGKYEWVVTNEDYYFKEGATFTDLSSGDLSIRWMPPGFAFDHAGNCLFPTIGNLWAWLALLNSKPFSHLMHINPTIHSILVISRKCLFQRLQLTPPL